MLKVGMAGNDPGYSGGDWIMVSIAVGNSGEGLVTFKSFYPKPDSSIFTNLSTNSMFNKWLVLFIPWVYQSSGLLRLF